MGWGVDAAHDLVNDDEILEGHGALEAVEGREQRLETVDLRAVRGGVVLAGKADLRGPKTGRRGTGQRQAHGGEGGRCAVEKRV